METTLNQMVKSYERVQRDRIATENVLRSVDLDPEIEADFKEHVKYLRERERRLRYKMLKKLKQNYLWTNWLNYVRGGGPITFAQMLSMIDWDRAPHPSSLFRYAGLHVVNGRAVRPKRGEKTSWNPKFKRVCFNLFTSFEKQTTAPRGPGAQARKKKGEKLPIGGYRKQLNKFKDREIGSRIFTLKLAQMDNYYAGHYFDPLSFEGFSILGSPLYGGDIETIKRSVDKNYIITLKDPNAKEPLKSKVNVRVKNLGPEHKGMIYWGIILTKDLIRDIRDEHSSSETVTLARTDAHIRLRVFRLVIKLFLSHLHTVHRWVTEHDVIVYYSATDNPNSPKHNWTYMPVLDVPLEKIRQKPKFLWWRSLFKKYQELGIKPIVI